MWAWSDIENEIDDGAVLSLHNAPSCTSDEHQLRTPPFYVSGIPWFVRLYAANASGKAPKEGGGSQFLAAYLDASMSLRENPDMEKQVTFTFEARRRDGGGVICRKEATFTFCKDSDNRGWRDCIPYTDNSAIELTVHIQDGAVATDRIKLTFKLDPAKHAQHSSGESDVVFNCKGSQAMLQLLDSYCLRQHLRPEKVSFRVTPKHGPGEDKNVEGESTPSDLGLQDGDFVLVTVKDDEVDAVVQKSKCHLLEAAEALEKCSYQPRKALQVNLHPEICRRNRNLNVAATKGSSS